MRILLVDVHCKNSSTGNIVYALHNKLQALGHESLLCYGRGENVTEKGIYKFAYDIETKIHAFLTRVTGYTGVFSYFSTKRLIKKMAEFKPDVVHLAELHSYFVNPNTVTKYLKKQGIKTLWSFHCDIMYTGKCGVAIDCDGYKTGCGKCPRLREYPKTLFFDHTAVMYKAKKAAFSNWDKLEVSTPSKWLSNRVKQSFLKDYPLSVIHNGVDTKVFKPNNKAYLDLRQNLNIDEDAKIILGAMPDLNDDIKGAKHIISMANKLISNGIHNVYVLILARRGSIPENLPNNVIIRFDGSNPQKMAEYYSAADVFVLTSKLETFSLTSAEALACGTPVVAFKCGAPETLFESPYAKFVEYGDTNAMLMGCLGEFSNPQNREAIANYANKEFSEKNMVNNYIKKYEEIYNK